MEKLRMEDLSAREQDVLRLIARGHSTKSISEKLSISKKTVETHRTHLNKKLGTKSPFDIIRRGLLSGVLKLDDLRD